MRSDLVCAVVCAVYEPVLEDHAQLSISEYWHGRRPVLGMTTNAWTEYLTRKSQCRRTMKRSVHISVAPSCVSFCLDTKSICHVPHNQQGMLKALRNTITALLSEVWRAEWFPRLMSLRLRAWMANILPSPWISPRLVQGVCRGRRGIAGTELLGSGQALRYYAAHAREARMC